MNQRQKRERRLGIVEDACRGVPHELIAKKCGLSVSYVKAVVMKGVGTTTKRAFMKKYSVKEQAENLRMAIDEFTVWQEEHLNYCDDYAGECCEDCHEGGVLYFVEDGDDLAYVCCEKRRHEGNFKFTPPHCSR